MNNLPARMKILKTTPLYKGGNLLIDIGCATGYFEVALANKYNKIIAITPEKHEYEKAFITTQNLENVEVYQSSFKNFNFNNIEADVAFLGNCIHYIFIEYNGFNFVDKLLSIAKDYLIIEYPYNIDLDESDMKVLKNNLKSKGLYEIFNKETILMHFLTYFYLEQELKSGSKTREILILRRK